MIIQRISRFLQDDDGAVTVDFVVLTAALVGLGVATLAVVGGGVEDVSGDINTTLRSDSIIQVAFAAPQMTLISSNNYIEFVFGTEICAGSGKSEGTLPCDQDDAYSKHRHSTTDGEQLTSYTSESTGEAMWVTSDGEVLSYEPERDDDYCMGRCFIAPEPEPIEVFLEPVIAQPILVKSN